MPESSTEHPFSSAETNWLVYTNPPAAVHPSEVRTYARAEPPAASRRGRSTAIERWVAAGFLVYRFCQTRLLCAGRLGFAKRELMFQLDLADGN